MSYRSRFVQRKVTQFVQFVYGGGGSDRLGGSLNPISLTVSSTPATTKATANRGTA